MNQVNSNVSSSGENGGWSRTRLRGMALAALAALGIYLCYRLAQPCIPSLVWAGALALIFAPLQRWLEARVRRPSLAAACSLAIIGLLVVVPATWFGQKVAEETAAVPQRIQKQLDAGKWRTAGNEHPHVARLLTLAQQQVGLPDNPSFPGTWLNTIMSKLIKQSAIAAVQVCLTLYFLFYLLRDRARVLKNIRSLLPLTERETDTLFCRINDTVHATLYGMLALSALQGLLGGLMFWWLGVPSPWLWALVAAVFAFVPVVDTFVLWLPAAVYLILEGRWGEALGVAALGALLVRGIENFLYPVLVRHRLKVSSVSIFVALLGGLLLFGWSGLVLGPVVLTATAALLDICAKRIGVPQLEVASPDHAGLEPLIPAAAGPTLVRGVADLPLNPGKVLKGQMQQA